MPAIQRLSEVVTEIEDSIRNRFSGRTFWIQAEIADVKKYTDKKWCFLKFTEKSGNLIVTELKGVFWSNTYAAITNFEQATGQVFASGLEITCQVRVKFHQRYGLNLEVIDIDYAYAVGKLEMERKLIIDQLLREQVIVQDESSGRYFSNNNRLPLPLLFQRIALITAPDSDGQRDFQKVIRNNKYGFAFSVTEFLSQIQGDTASRMILERLSQVQAAQSKFDIVVIARGGGSDTDFKSFNDYELAKAVAGFPLPVLTGIGHDRNTSITDLVARQMRTPTEVATFILEHHMSLDREVDELKKRLYRAADLRIERAKNMLEAYQQRINNLSPATILKKGFAILSIDGKIVTNPDLIAVNATIQATLKNVVIESTVTKKNENENER